MRAPVECQRIQRTVVEWHRNAGTIKVDQGARESLGEGGKISLRQPPVIFFVPSTKIGRLHQKFIEILQKWPELSLSKPSRTFFILLKLFLPKIHRNFPKKNVK